MEIDKSSMQKVILDFPKQFRTGLRAAENIKILADFNSVLVCGMGGSALPADILGIWLEANKINLPLHIHHDYGLPHHADGKHLVVCISYSGNTEETLSAFDEARQKLLKITAIASGGKITELCRLHKIPIAIIPQGLQPRMAVGFQFAALAKILANSGLINKDNLKDISGLEDILKPEILAKQGKKIAKNLMGKIPLVYASGRLAALARIWKIKFNENSKIPAFCNYFPELNHNEMVGFTQNKGFYVIILKDAADHPRNIKRMELTAQILKKRGLGVDIIDITGNNILSKVFSSIIVADWASCYLALEQGVDPAPVKIVEEFKKKLRPGGETGKHASFRS